MNDFVHFGADNSESGKTGNSGGDNSGKGTPSGDRSPPNGSGGGGGNSDWLGGLDQETRTWAEGKGVKSLPDLFKSYRELEGRLGKREQQSSEKPDYKLSDFDFKPLKEADAKAIGYSADFENSFKQFMKEQGADPKTAAAVRDWYVQHAQGTVQGAAAAQQEKLTQAIGDATKEIRKDWGAPDTPGFKRNVELAQRAMRNLEPGLEKALFEVGVLKEIDGKPAVANATIIKALAKAGAAMFSEDTIDVRLKSGVNPFAKDTEDTRLQGELIKKDPTTARQLIESSGRPERFRYTLSKLPK